MLFDVHEFAIVMQCLCECSVMSPPTWHLYRFLENAPFLLPDRFVGTLCFLALSSSDLGCLVLGLSGCGVVLRMDHTQPAVLQSLLQKQNRNKHHGLKMPSCTTKYSYGNDSQTLQQNVFSILKKKYQT